MLLRSAAPGLVVAHTRCEARHGSPCIPLTRTAPVRHARLVARRVSAGASPPQRSEAAEAAILSLTDGLRLLESERDEAVRVAEDAAKTAVKLEEMARLLEQLAGNKLAEGDEGGARQVLQEKVAVQEVLSRTSNRANVNFALAGKLAEKIGQQQADIMALLSPPSAAADSSRSSSGSSSSTAQQPVTAAPSSSSTYRSAHSTTTSTTSASAPASSSAGTTAARGAAYASEASSSSGAGSGSAYEAPWERSLREARERVSQAEAQAAAAGHAARASARETIEEARERLRAQSFESIAAARSRIRRSASESIEEARARIAAEDAAALAEVHAVIARYKGGGYVSEDELDWAFRQLERRSWRP